MKKKLKKSLVILLTFAMLLSTIGVYASPGGEETKSMSIAEIYGEYNFSSSSMTKVIVELDEPSIIEAKHSGKAQSKGKLAQERNRVINSVNNQVNDAIVNREYDYVFSGFSLELPTNEIPKLVSIPGIKAIYPNVEYTTAHVGETVLITEEFMSPMMLDSAPYIGSNEVWEAGYTGKGVTVAIIDTGVDYNHPDLKDRFGDYKGWDFVDNNDDPMETLPGDPRGGATDHGTHVAGTVAANGYIKGVAPDATLLAYRVLGPGGSGTTENVVAGIERAVLDGADIMNLSLGNSLNNPDWATSIALDWAMAEGVVAVTSNGNSGPNNWTVGSPGTSRRAISVGASQLPYNVYGSTLFTSEGVTYPSAKVMGFPNEEALLNLDGRGFEFVDVGLGYPQDFEGKDLEGKIALISRGEFAFVDKATNAKNAGAVGAIIYNNVDGEHADVPGMAVPTIKTTLADGQKLLAELEAGNNVIHFDIAFLGEVGETVAGFSSRGPVVGTWMIKPDVLAPGVSINSTIRDGQYGSKQGTSMAAPHVAGAAALILQANPNWGVEEVKAALMNTAENLVDPARGVFYPHNTQGAGSIRVAEAINTKTLVLPGSHSFGIFSKNRGRQIERQSFTIKNLSNERKTYSFVVEFADNPAGIKSTTGMNLRVNGNSSQKVNLNLQVDASQLPAGYYEGTIKVSDGKEVMEIPTILFVQEPDYPRITHFTFDQYGEGIYSLTTYLPYGADLLEFHLYDLDGSAIGQYIGTIGKYTNIPLGYNTFQWNGVIEDETISAGEYVVIVNAEKSGGSTVRAYIIEIE